jgi:hypothetical protein
MIAHLRCQNHCQPHCRCRLCQTLVACTNTKRGRLEVSVTAKCHCCSATVCQLLLVIVTSKSNVQGTSVVVSPDTWGARLQPLLDYCLSWHRYVVCLSLSILKSTAFVSSQLLAHHWCPSSPLIRCSTYKTFAIREPEVKRQLWTWGIILKQILKEQSVMVWAGCVWLKVETSWGCYEYGSEPSGCIKRCEFLDCLNDRVPEWLGYIQKFWRRR